MAELVDTKVWRGAARWRGEKLRGKVDLEVRKPANGPPRVRLATAITSGSGYSEVGMAIGSDDFRALADAMIEANRNAALAALSAAMAVRLNEEEGAVPPASLTKG